MIGRIINFWCVLALTIFFADAGENRRTMSAPKRLNLPFPICFFLYIINKVMFRFRGDSVKPMVSILSCIDPVQYEMARALGLNCRAVWNHGIFRQI